MQYFFLKPLPFFSPDEPNVIIEMGKVGRTVWSCLPKWKYGVLECLEILRSSDVGKFEIQIILIPSYDNNISCEMKMFKETFEHGQKTRLIILNGLLDLLKHGSNKFQGYVVVYDSSKCKIDNKSTVSSNSSASNTLPQLSDDFLRLLDGPNSFADATLKCGTAAISVHKNILSVRSPVFAAMFKSEMQEGRYGIVNITDVKLDVLYALLRYMYGGKIDSLTDVLAGDLLFVADKYQVEELKFICVEKLKCSMTKKNIFSILILGNFHDKSLKTHAVEFLCSYDCFSKLEKTEEWKSLEEEYPSLALEVLKSIVKKLEHLQWK